METFHPQIAYALELLRHGKSSGLAVELDPKTRTAKAFSELRDAGDRMGIGIVDVPSIESDQLSARSRLLEALAGTEADRSDSGVIADQVAELLDSISQDRPVAVIIEDAGWSDPATVLALHTLPEHLRHLPILWVVGIEAGTSRADRVVDSLRSLGLATVSAESSPRTASPDTHVALLEVAAVIGVEFDVDVAARVLSRSAGSLLGEINRAIVAGVLVEQGSKLRFADAQLRNDLYEGLPVSVRKALHYEVARVLDSPGTAAETVWHLAHSTSRLTDHDLAIIRNAIGRLASVAPEDAAELAFQVSDLFTPLDPRHIEFRTTATAHLGNTKRIGEALGLLERLDVSGLSSREEARLRLVAAELHQAAGDDREAMTHLTRALALPELNPGVKVALLKTQSTGHVNLGEIEEAIRVSRPLLDAARRSREPATKVSVDLFASQLAFSQAQLATSLDLAEQAASGVEISATRPLHPPRIPELWLASAMLSTDRAGEASDLLLGGQRRAEQRGLAWSLPYWHTVRAIELWMRNELDDAAAEAETALHEAARLGIVRPLPWTRSLFAIVELDRGNVINADRLLEGARLSARPRAYDIWTAAALIRLRPDAVSGASQPGAWLNQHANLARLMSLPPKIWPTLVAPDGRSQRIQSFLDEIRRTSPEQQVVVSAVTTAMSVSQRPVSRRPERGEPVTSGWGSLTASELRVTGLVVGGHTNRSIAEQLHVSVHTVSTHLRHVFTKLNINTRVELTRLALLNDVVLTEK